MKDDPYARLEAALERHRAMDADAVVYHYTSLEALQGILSGDQPALWASDLRFLNDSAERAFGEQLFLATLDRYRGHPGHDTVRAALEDQAPVREANSVTLVAALSRARDSLSQWRGYGRDETGAAIGFRIGGLAADAALFDVVYGGRPAEDLARAFVEAALEIGAAPSGLPCGGRRLAPLKSRLVTILKHEAFADEQELRIYRDVPLAECRFRCTGRFLVPYQDIGIQRDTVAEVVLAPGEHADTRRLGVELFLRHWGYHVPVVVSDVPFRP